MLDRAAQIQYGELPKLEAELKKFSHQEQGDIINMSILL